MGRKEMSLRHEKHKHYTLVEPAGVDGRCVIMNDAGLKASVKAAWLDFDGTDCWAGSRRKEMHIENADWA